MTDPDEDFAPPPPRSRFRRMRKLAHWSLGVVAVVVLVLYVGRWQAGRVGQRQLAVATDRLDAADPGWRLDAVIDARNKAEPPPNENSAPVVLAIAAGIPDAWRKWHASAVAREWADWGVHNHLPPRDAIAAARVQAAATLALRGEALRLRDTRSGAYPLDVGADPLATPLPHLEKCRAVTAFLQYDAYLAAVDRNPNRAVSATRAALAVSRSIGDEPFFISQHVRTECAKCAAQTALQVLAWSEPTDGLAELQAELLSEAEYPHFRVGMRGERALIDKVFRGFEDGTIPPDRWFVYADMRNRGPEQYAAFRAYRALIPGDHAQALAAVAAYVEAADRPPHERLAAIQAVPVPEGVPEGMYDKFRFLATRLLVPTCERLAEADLRCRADLSLAAAAIACERFRLKNARWPDAPAELVPAFLPAVPLNPFDGTPLRYRVYPDHVAVYFFWANSPFRGEFPEEFRPGNTPGIGIWYDAWNPDRRGLPAEEKKAP